MQLAKLISCYSGARLCWRFEAVSSTACWPGLSNLLSCRNGNFSSRNAAAAVPADTRRATKAELEEIHKVSRFQATYTVHSCANISLLVGVGQPGC
jgi:hypothetical protein